MASPSLAVVAPTLTTDARRRDRHECAKLAGAEAEEAEMGVWAWFRGVFSSAGPDDEAAEREEFGVADRGETELQRDTRSGFVPSESADLARHELDALEAPPDSAP
jgi:hypothetical protein